MVSTGSAIAQAALLVSFPVAAAIIGSVVSVLRSPGPKLTSALDDRSSDSALLGQSAQHLTGDGRHR